ncbi:MAG: hypothetical protein ABIS06_08125 [Vicinamibacterales bacterium]
MTSLRETAIAVHPDGKRLAFVAGDPVAIEIWLLENAFKAQTVSR